MKEQRIEITRPRKIDMSAAAVTARIKRACQFGEAEILAAAMRDAIVEITTGKTNPRMYPKWKLGR